MTYNESFNSDDKLQSLLQKFGKSIDTKKLLEDIQQQKLFQILGRLMLELLMEELNLGKLQTIIQV